MMKIANFSTKNENDAVLLGTYIKDDKPVDNTIVKNNCNNTMLTTEIEIANGAFLQVV